MSFLRNLPFRCFLAFSDLMWPLMFSLRGWLYFIRIPCDKKRQDKTSLLVSSSDLDLLLILIQTQPKYQQILREQCYLAPHVPQRPLPHKPHCLEWPLHCIAGPTSCIAVSCVTTLHCYTYIALPKGSLLGYNVQWWFLLLRLMHSLLLREAVE